MTTITLRPDQSYPVLACSLELARAACREAGRTLDFRGDLAAALREVLPARRGDAVTLWAREDHGMDALNSPALLIFVCVATDRGGDRLADRLWQALRSRWGDVAVQMEGRHPPVGGEVVVCELG